ncbi:MAG: hypothetical protein R2712_22275 [Vicinamibacterales bacterium]
MTIRPGAYPWRNHPNAWRPAHIHFSLFGEAFLTRLVTQMYPGDPLLPLDPIFNAIPDARARPPGVHLRPLPHRTGVRTGLPFRHRPAGRCADADGRSMMAGLTPFQTVGPCLHLGLRVGRGPMTAAGLDTAIVIRGRLVDGAGDGIGDGVLEFWASGFDDIGRVWTDADGGYELQTLKPAGREDATGIHAPHFAVRVLGRGIMTGYVTRVYFDDEPENTRDVVLSIVPAERRDTLVAARSGPSEYRFDVCVQGEGETVFLDA